MFLTDFAVRRPVAMSCLIIALVLFGLNAYRTIGLEFMPAIDIPYMTVVTVYPGAAPEEIETDVAKRIEDAVVAVDGLKHVSSVCMENMCQTMLEFQLGVDVDVVATDVREKIDMIIQDFPDGVEDPQILKFDINAIPIINLALTGDVPLDDLYDYADNTLRDRVSVLQGVADVQLIGGAEREVHVILRRDALAARGLTTLDIIDTIQNNVRTIPVGRLQEKGTEYAVKFDADYAQIARLGELEVAAHNGQRCYLRDLADIQMASDEVRQTAFIDSEPCIGVRVIKKADANAVRVVDRVREAMGTLQETLPGGMRLIWISDDGGFIRATVNSATINILQGVLLTAVILFLFLYNFRSTIIVGISMPVSIIISLAFLQFMNYTLNTSTLLALGLSVGILVTNSIVVLESIVKRLHNGATPAEAADLGTREVGVAVLASAGTNLVVLLPVALMGSMMGLFFRPFATTMIVVTVVSLFISFTLTPILCSILLKRTENKGLLARIEAGFNYLLGAFSRGYVVILEFLAKRRWAAIALLLAVVAAFLQATHLAPSLGMSFVPQSDAGRIFVKLEFPTHYDLENTTARTAAIEKRLEDLPALEHVFTTIGKVEGIIGQTSEGVYLAQILLKFTDMTERPQHIDELVAMTRERTSGIPDCIATVNVADMIGGQGTPIELEIAGDDFSVLDELALKSAAYAEEMDTVVDPDTTVRFGKPELRVIPRRAVLADLGMPATALGYALRGNVEGIKAGLFKQGDRSYDIRVKLEDQPGKDQVAQFAFPGAPGNPVILSNYAEIEEGVAPVQITRTDKRRVAKIFANLKGAAPLGTAVDNLSHAIDTRAELPPGYSYRFAGEYEIMDEGAEAFGQAGIMAVLLTYLVLAAILESFLQPFIIMVTLPLGLIGVLWSLYVADESISMFIMLGTVMLVGIVVNNAILIMAEVNQSRERGDSRRHAMVHAAADQLRPILMITLAAVLGMAPLAFGRGLGSELRSGIGLSSMGGIFVAAILTLIVLPVLYDLFTKREPKKQNPKT